MIWLKRACWIAAWSVWVWCGVGLARELPRSIGSTQGRLALAEDELIDRLVVGTHLAVSRSIAPDGVRSRRVWDLRTGEISAERLAPRVDAEDRDFLDQRGPRNEREDLIELSNRYLESVKSTDGRIELNVLDNLVKEIASGRIIDSGGADQPVFGVGPLRLAVIRSFGTVPGANIYICEEYWSGTLGAASVRKDTYAVHALADGRLLYRLCYPPPWVTSDGTLCLHSNGDIEVFPPDPNYRLLALCQTILALPLILLWTILRWRRKASLRLASVQP